MFVLLEPFKKKGRRIQKVMEEAEQKREEELYLEEREKFGEQLKKEDEIRSDIRKSLNK